MDALCSLIWKLYNSFIGFILFITWIIGWIIADSWWGIIPFYSWYKFLDAYLNYYHILGIGT